MTTLTPDGQLAGLVLLAQALKTYYTNDHTYQQYTSNDKYKNV